MRFLPVFLLLILVTWNLSAQTDSAKYFISGTVKVQIGKKLIDLPGAVVRLMGTDRGAIAKSHGEFKIKNIQRSGYYTLSVGAYYSHIFDTTIVLKDKPLENFVIICHANCDSTVNKEFAQKDTNINVQKLILWGSSTIKPIDSVDRKFEKEYKIQYYEYKFEYNHYFPPSFCVLMYHQRIFEYLDSKYGTAWRKEVRKDVVGFQELEEK